MLKTCLESSAMFSTNDIYSLTDFQRNAKDHVERLAETKRPEVLTVKGKAQVVVQDAKAYEMMVDELETIKKVNAAAAAFDRGEGRPIEEAFSEMDKRFKEKYDV
jgi:PHD/YefM family antitoxin component YafN of YafNO toxin-antitoxin module